MINFKGVFSKDDRTSKFKRNTFVLLFCQISGIGLSLFLVPLTLKYLGVAEYGIWITLIGLIEWFNFFDIGLGHGLRNRYAEAKSKDDILDLKKYVSTAFFTMMFISASIFVVFCSISSFVNWATILNAPNYLSSQLAILAMLLIGMFCLRFVVNIVSVLLTADQDPAIPALIMLSGSFLSLVGIYILTTIGETSLLVLGMCLSASQVLPLFISFIYFFSTRYSSIKPNWKYFSKKHINSIFSLGFKFFLIQITALLLFQSNNIIIAHVCGLRDVTSFNIAFKYFNMLSTAFMTLVTPLWSATTDAYTRGDITWIEKTFKRLNKIWILLGVGGVLMLFIAPFVYQLWLGDKIKPEMPLLILLLFYFLFFMRSTLYRSFMNGVGKIKMQFVVTSIQAVLHIPLAIMLGKAYGILGVVSVMLLWVIINSIWEPIQYKKIITNKASGLWIK